jgi:hypothetical protein
MKPDGAAHTVRFSSSAKMEFLNLESSRPITRALLLLPSVNLLKSSLFEHGPLPESRIFVSKLDGTRNVNDSGIKILEQICSSQLPK